MSYATALLIALAAAGGSKSGADWQWIRDQTCGVQQVLPDKRTIMILQTPVHDLAPVLMIEDREKAERSWRPLSGVELTLEPGDKFVVDGAIFPNGQANGRSFGIVLGKTELLTQLSQASEVTLSHESVGTVSVHIRSSSVAVRGVQECVDRKSREWGVDLRQLASLQSQPIPLTSPATWFSSVDYPLNPARYGAGGYVVVKLDVGTDGRVKACSVVNQQAATEFHTAACQGFMKRGRFKPATDATGRPTTAPFVQQIRFAPRG